jgi:hypothetical protein
MQQNNISMRERALMVLGGQIPERLPFITRLETWHKAHLRDNTLPEKFRGMSLADIHQAVGVGRLKFSVPFKFRLVGAEIHVTFNGDPLCHLIDPVVENFPGLWDLVPTDKAGTTHTDIITPVGNLSLTHTLLQDGVFNGTDPYMKEHLVKNPADLRVVEYILEHTEITPNFSTVKSDEELVGGHGLVVPLIQRIPFQQVLLEYLGEMELFYLLHDDLDLVHYLLNLLDQQMLTAIELIADMDVPYVEFPDNLHGLMTNPRLFKKYCLQSYQKYTDLLHRQGKKVGSHTDGDIRSLISLLSESGLDVCESFSPAPLTTATFADVNKDWRGKPLVWGAIPTPILEENTSEPEFQAYIDGLFRDIDQPLILGLVDLFLRHNSIERVESIAHRVENLDLPGWINTNKGRLT